MALHALKVLGFLVLFVNLSVQHDESTLRRQSHKVARSIKNFFMNRKALHRQKRAWIIDTFELQEEHPGPYPLFIGEVNVDNAIQVRYKLTGIGVTEEPTGMFHINEDDGAIYVHQKVDYEKFPLFRWEFNAINRTSLEVDTRLGIQLKILDINDNAPEFSAKYYEVYVNESAVQGVPFFSIIARDIDEPSSPNSEVSYMLLSQKPVDPNVEFTVDSQRGFLSFKGCLDYETSKSYKLIIQARDNGRSVKQTSTCEVQVFVVDRNNYQPTWKADAYDGSIPERDFNVTILRLGVTDQDTPHTPAWRAVYTIKTGNERGSFKIETDPETNEGLLTVIKPLDFEGGPLNKLSITVKNEEPFFMCKVVKKSSTGLWVVDTGKTMERKFQESQTRSTLIKVLDVNDPPDLNPPRITIYMDETDVSGQKLGVLNATDPDTAFPNVIRYQVLSDPAGWISVDEHTGVITSKTSVDRESDYVINNTYTAILLAVDDGVPAMTGTATLVINIKDVNDNIPKIMKPYILICAGQEEALVTVPVEDKDINPYSGPFHFELLEKEHFKEQLELKDIYGDSLQVLQLKGANRGNHTMRLQISDKQGMESLQNLTVNVCDCVNGSICLNTAAPPSLGGGAIALLLLALLLLCVGCLLLCKIETAKVMVPFDQEPLNTMVVYNEEGGNKDCEVYAAKDEVDGNFHRASTRRFVETAAVGAGLNSANGAQSSTIQNQNMSGRQMVVSQFDRDNKRRHSSYHGKEQQRARNMRSVARSHSIATGSRHASLLRNMSANGYRAHTLAVSGSRRTYSTTDSVVTDYKLKTLEAYLRQTLHNSSTDEAIQENYKPRVFAEEGEWSRASSLETISMEGSNFNLDRLHYLGSKFNILEHICTQEIEIKSQSEENEKALSTSI
ncbi:cadherin-like protein 26 [Lissotriton helveticus]